MKIINRHNFFSTGCVIFTMLVMGKILLEAAASGIFTNDQANLLVMFVLSFLATFVLSQHYRFQNLPLLAVILGQYVLLVGVVMLITWVSSFFEPLHKDSWRDMFLSFTIPYVIGAVVYYISLFCEIRHMNNELKEIRRYQNDLQEKKDDEKKG